MPTPEDALRDAMVRYEREDARIEERRSRNRERRNKAIRQANGDGLSLRKIGRMTGLSFQRVSQIIRDE